MRTLRQALEVKLPNLLEATRKAESLGYDLVPVTAE